MLFAKIFDLSNIVTPVKADIFAQLLKEAWYPQSKIETIHQGFTNGFDIGYTGPKERQSYSQNIPLRVGTKTQLWNKLMKEIKLGWVAGPFEKVPFDNFIQSPIGLVPKKGSDKVRLIFHLSYDFNDSTQG